MVHIIWDIKCIVCSYSIGENDVAGKVMLDGYLFMNFMDHHYF